MKPGDYVAYPSKIDRMIHLGVSLALISMILG